MPHTSKPSEPSTQAAPSELTAPRKPVAWVDPKHLLWLSDGRMQNRPKDGVKLKLSLEQTLERKQPLYTAPDLQPLRALVEKLEDEARLADAVLNAHRGGGLRHASNLIRATLEAMQ